MKTSIILETLARVATHLFALLAIPFVLVGFSGPLFIGSSLLSWLQSGVWPNLSYTNIVGPIVTGWRGVDIILRNITDIHIGMLLIFAGLIGFYGCGWACFEIEERLPK